MAKDCFCGCGRDIPFGRMRIANRLGDRISRDVPLLRAGLTGQPPPANADVLAQLLGEGETNREVTRYVHRELDRDQLDRDGLEAWMKRMTDVRPALVGDTEEAAEQKTKILEDV